MKVTSSVTVLPGGHLWLLSSEVWQFPTYTNTNLSTFVASDLTNGSNLARNIGDQKGVGMMAAGITAPFKFGSNPTVFILWSMTASNFYPGIQYYVWNVQNNTLPSSGSFGGSQNPSGCTSTNPCRWVDFIDLAKPVPQTLNAPGGTVLLGGPVSYSQPETRVIVTKK